MHEPTSLTSIADSDAQIVLDEMWRVLDAPALPTAANGGPPFSIYRNTLRKLSLKMALEYGILPQRFVLVGVERLDDVQRGAGGFADVFCGMYLGCKVALKKLRVYVMSSDSQKEDLKKAFYRESILWKNLVHVNIVSFLGVSEDVFKGTVCMVMPWFDRGSLRHYLDTLRKKGKLDGNDLSVDIDNWLYQTTLGMKYLHDEGIVHGDLHAGNILLDERGHACLTDFGMSLIAEATGYNYGSIHGGGAIRWQAPELIDPDEFGLTGTRPTTQSDVFLVACTAVELYSGMPLLPRLKDIQVSKHYVKGKRPPRPCLPGGKIMADTLWSVIEACWTQVHLDRPSIHQVVDRLAVIVKNVPSSSTALVHNSNLPPLPLALTTTSLIPDSDTTRLWRPVDALTSIASAYSGDEWNLPEALESAYSSLSESDRIELAKQSNSGDIGEAIISLTKQILQFWESLDNGLVTQLRSDPGPSAGNSDPIFIYMWMSQILHTKLDFKPGDMEKADLQAFLQKALVKDEDEDVQLVLLHSEISIPDMKSMDRAQQKAYLTSGDIQAIASLIVTLAEQSRASVTADRDLSRLRYRAGCIKSTWEVLVQVSEASKFKRRKLLSAGEAEWKDIVQQASQVEDFVEEFDKQVQPVIAMLMAWLGMLAKQK
ncbi:hypothetical protein EUX98_g5016 [Antrodiella citrinella]|uniref:Protein kinase domain-containing protein n=1 Tax=Antrodiella citrinella TaxID=2447956 RepID=A0A4S4MVD1_9APHY|nr:hypothetical protein EUX98_g5016 [Antrodiella citrinella]